MSEPISKTVKITVVLAFWGTYIVLFADLDALVGRDVGALSMIPVAITAWAFGLRIGIVSALVGAGLNAYLFARAGYAVANAWAPVITSFTLLAVAAIVGYARTLHDRLEAQRRDIQRRAERDGLTGVLTRAALMERSGPLAKVSNGFTAVLYLDLDGFKEVNDTLGHAAGDQVLREIARRLTSTLRTSDLVARLGGDEFVILAPHLERPEDAATVARNVLAALRAPHTIHGAERSVPASIGVSLIPSDGEDMERLLGQADTAMYRVKNEGGDGHHLFDPDLDRETSLKHRLLLDLREAVEQEQFELVYQPQLELASGRPTGFEALLRWNHPHLGQLAPAAFLSLAELNELIVPIGEWVVRTACTEARRWDDEGYEPLAVAVNVSGAQLADPDFVAMIRRALLESGLPPARLELEITETMLVQDTARAVRTLDSLREVGVHLALDDFGAESSSLRYLRMLPLDTLKIDRSCVLDLMEREPDGDESQAIIHALAGLAHALGLRAVMEGVETETELAWSEASGSDHAQGFLLARPMPASRIATWLERYAETTRDAGPREAVASSTPRDASE